MNNTTPKAQYFVAFQTGNGSQHAIPVAMDKEIDNVQDYQEMVKTVGGYAVAQGFTRSLDDVRITTLNLLNPSRDVNVIANELLEKAFVKLYNKHYEGAAAVDSDMLEMYNAINGIEEVTQ